MNKKPKDKGMQASGPQSLNLDRNMKAAGAEAVWRQGLPRLAPGARLLRAPAPGVRGSPKPSLAPEVEMGAASLSSLKHSPTQGSVKPPASRSGPCSGGIAGARPPPCPT